MKGNFISPSFTTEVQADVGHVQHQHFKQNKNDSGYEFVDSKGYEAGIHVKPVDVIPTSVGVTAGGYKTVSETNDGALIWDETVNEDKYHLGAKAAANVGNKSFESPSIDIVSNQTNTTT
eukprot:377778_1